MTEYIFEVYLSISMFCYYANIGLSLFTLYSMYLITLVTLQIACCNIAKTEKKLTQMMNIGSEYQLLFVKPIVYSIYCIYIDVCVLLATYLHYVLTTSNL